MQLVVVDSVQKVVQTWFTAIVRFASRCFAHYKCEYAKFDVVLFDLQARIKNKLGWQWLHRRCCGHCWTRRRESLFARAFKANIHKRVRTALQLDTRKVLLQGDHHCGAAKLESGTFLWRFQSQQQRWSFASSYMAIVWPRWCVHWRVRGFCVSSAICVQLCERLCPNGLSRHHDKQLCAEWKACRARIRLLFEPFGKQLGSI